ncbi:hypothetical protein CKA32_006780 [Geitlerinema sp. FC II]|nr:hypothetical protein CKA32_006780 [Geitlerinema sp. FC II]
MLIVDFTNFVGVWGRSSMDSVSMGSALKNRTILTIRTEHCHERAEY